MCIRDRFELYQNRRLIWRLAKNDFKRRYAGSYMGAIWAMVQPVVTVAMYYVVFQVIMPQKAQLLGDGIEVPYLVFLTAGLVPWFYFSEALTNGMMALLEYEYLVKKVVFKISILPIIKIIAATFIHGFFVLVLLAIAFLYGFTPSLYTLQIFYYSFCMFALVLAISYTTCSVVIYFRDLQQIVGIGLQIGIDVYKRQVRKEPRFSFPLLLIRPMQMHPLTGNPRMTRLPKWMQTVK